MDEFISRMFSTRDMAHLFHLNMPNKSGYQHILIGEFYEKLISTSDHFIESYKTLTGTKLGYPIIKPKKFTGNMKVLLENDLDYLMQNRDALTMKNPVLGTLLDNVCIAYIDALKIEWLE